MMSSDQQFFLKWNDFQTNMVTSFRHLRDEKSFTDVSIFYFIFLIVHIDKPIVFSQLTNKLFSMVIFYGLFHLHSYA